MATEEEISVQQERLRIYRQTLAHYLHQQAIQGAGNVSPSIMNGIIDARDNIRRIKMTLRRWEVHCEDHPDDESAGLPTIASGTFSGSTPRQPNRIGILIDTILSVFAGSLMSIGFNYLFGLYGILIAGVIIVLLLLLVQSTVQLYSFRQWTLNMMIGFILGVAFLQFSSYIPPQRSPLPRPISLTSERIYE